MVSVRCIPPPSVLNICWAPGGLSRSKHIWSMGEQLANRQSIRCYHKAGATGVLGALVVGGGVALEGFLSYLGETGGVRVGPVPVWGRRVPG